VIAFPTGIETDVLNHFLVANRAKLIARCRDKVAQRRAPRATPAELEHGIPLFVSQITAMFPNGGAVAQGFGATPGLADTATRHGSELLHHGFTIDQVVHDYGDLCQSITELAAEQDFPITVPEFGILNINLDNAIAGAVAEYSRQREAMLTDKDALAAKERLGVLAHEMRNLLNTTILAISAIKGASVGFGGATAKALDRSLIGMRGLIDRTLAEVRLEAGSPSLRERIEIGPLILEVQVAAALEASSRGCDLTVAAVEPGLFVDADRHILAAAVANLLQNAFKFTRDSSHVLLSAYASNGRILIDVADECGGIPEATIEGLFRPFEQRAKNREGVGLGLSISRQAAEASGGKLYARNVSGTGCVFTIDLPRKT
jgi:signal transduction histidine kinase